MSIQEALGVAITLSGLCSVATCSHDVTGPEVGSIVLELEADTLSVNQTTQLHATVLGEGGETLSSVVVKLESGDEDIVTISDMGLITAKGPGTAMITARTGDRAESITIHVRRAASISVAPSDTTLLIDDRLILVATVLDADSAPIEDAVVSWAVDRSVVFRVSQAGLTAEFRANRAGSGVITATTEGLTYDVNVTVDRSEVGSVILSPDSLRIERGRRARLTVIVRDTTGAVIEDPQVVFTCDCATAASVDSTGLVTGLSTGRMNTITARSRGVNSNPVQVRVILAPSAVGSVSLSPDSVTVAVGRTTQLTVTILDKTGAVVPWLPGEVQFRCGFFLSFGKCLSLNDVFYAEITSTGLVHRVRYPNIGPEPVTAWYPTDHPFSQRARSNTVWLSTK